jgi:16S rRNA (guanine(527)-N(7))-methyltransferase RsmG
MFHGERSRLLLIVPRGTEPISDQRPNTEEILRAEFEERILAALMSLEIPNPELPAARLAGLTFLLSSWAPRMNLTGHRTPEAILSNLVLDGVAIGCRIPKFQTLVDLGSGAGFPALPIAIAFPDRSITTVESRSRRVSFQRHVVRELGLENVEVLEGRIESFDIRERDCVIAQALAPPPGVLQYMVPWCRAGGILAIPGTTKSLDFTLPRDSRVEDPRIEQYSVPSGAPNRLVWIGRNRTPGV